MTHGLNQVAAYRVADMLDTQAKGIVKIGALLRHSMTLPDHVEQAVFDNIMELDEIIANLEALLEKLS